jgi:Circularly permutated YpsA SLOG family
VARLIVISGRQSGVDRAALDAAIARGMAYAGWCPRGGWAEDMREPPGLLAIYPHLRETPSADPAQRTEWNVRDAEASLILVAAGGNAVSPGTALAERLAARDAKPRKVIDADAPDAVAQARAWLTSLLGAHRGETFRLAIGGPRESEAPGIYETASVIIGDLFDTLAP